MCQFISCDHETKNNFPRIMSMKPLLSESFSPLKLIAIC